MQVLYPRCAGLDVHKDSVVTRIRCVSAPLHDEVRSFATTTSALLELSDWLSSHGVTHVAMEATGATGNRYGICSKGISSRYSPTPSTSAMSPGAKPM